MNFDDAIKAHAAWKMKLSQYIAKPDGTLKAGDIEPDNRCMLGKWIYENASLYENMNEYQELKDCHKNFHRCAADIVRKADSGANLTDEVALGSKSAYGALSNNIVQLIMRMRRSVEKAS